MEMHGNERQKRRENRVCFSSADAVRAAVSGQVWARGVPFSLLVALFLCPNMFEMDEWCHHIIYQMREIKNTGASQFLHSLPASAC